MSEAESTNDVAALTVQLLSVYLANNAVPSEDLAGLIRSTRNALGGELAAVAQAEPETAKAAVSVRKSLASPEHIISLIDGKPYKTLKRHLMAHGMTPEAYRSRYNLPANYPMVAPAYADHRRAVAQRIGLGARRSAARDIPDSKDDQLDEPGAVDAQASLSQAAPEPGAKQKRATAANKVAGTRATKARAANAGSSSGVAPKLSPAAGERTSSDVANSLGDESAQVEATAAPQAVEPAPKAPTPKSVPAKAPRKMRGKLEVAATQRADLSANPSTASDLAVDEQNTQAAAKPQRRAKLGVFKKSAAVSDTTAKGDATPAEDTSSQPKQAASKAPAAAARAPAKRKSPKRMARSSSEPGEGGSAK